MLEQEQTGDTGADASDSEAANTTVAARIALMCKVVFPVSMTLGT